MSIVKFATLCDRCDARSPEYAAWPTCRMCLSDICHDCGRPGTEGGGDGERETVVCIDCDPEDDPA